MTQTVSEKKKTHALPLIALFVVAGFASMLNEVQMNIALPSISEIFGLPLATVQWLTTAFMLVVGMCMPIAAYAMQRFPLKKIFLCAIGLLTLGLVVAACANGFEMLLVGRVMQAVGTALFLPMMMTVVLTLAPKDKFGFYNGLIMFVMLAAPAVGPTLAGSILGALGWRWLFIVLIPVLVIIMIVATFFLDNLLETRKIKLDIPSVFLSLFGFGGIVFAIGNIPSMGVASPVTLVSLVVGVICFVFYVRRQVSIDNPLLSFGVLKKPVYRNALILIALVQTILFGSILVCPLFLQAGLGMTALEAGLIMLPAGIINAASSFVAGIIYDKKGVGLAPIGMGIAAFGGFGIAATILMGWDIGVFICFYIVFNIGMPVVLTPLNSSALSSLSQKEYPHGTTLTNTTQQIFGSIGTAVFTLIVYNSPILFFNEGLNAVSNGVEIAFGSIAIVFVVLAIIAPRMLRATPGETTASAPVTFVGVRPVMKTDVFTIPSTATVKDVMEVLFENKTSGLPVVNADGKVVGFISDGDILKALTQQTTTEVSLSFCLAYYKGNEEFAQRLQEVSERNVMDLATKKVLTIDIAASLDTACEVLGERRIKKMPVLQDGKLVGSLSRSDVIRYLLHDFTDVPA